MTSWESSANWYKKCVGDEGHTYHRDIILPNLLRLLKSTKSLLELGCGTGVLAAHLPPKVHYCGIDLSSSLIRQAKKQLPQTEFHVADACQPLPIDKRDFDTACFLLSLQNMEHGDKAIAIAKSHLKPNGKLLLILNHPCFRIPRQSAWGVDEQKQIQYRRLDSYLSPQKIPIQTNPSKGEQSALTYSFHNPLSVYFDWLAQAGCAVTALEEWSSPKVSTGGAARRENRARKEFPLFLTILATYSTST